MSSVLYHGPSRWEAQERASDYNETAPPGLLAQFVDLGEDRYCMAIVDDDRPQLNAHCAPFWRLVAQNYLDRTGSCPRDSRPAWVAKLDAAIARLLDLARRADRGMNP